MTLPDFSFEKKMWKQDFKIVAGVDEVGRGCFAGPVVAAAVAFAPNQKLKIKIDDSKKLTPEQRERADKWVRENALAVGIGQASVAQINKFGIKKASEIAFRKAIKMANHCLQNADYSLLKKQKTVSSNQLTVDCVLIDAFYISYVKGLRRKNQRAIVKGDTKSISIAAASIVAKVYRDKLMTKISKNPKFRVYKWGKNKGYGTKEHQNAIKKYGITRQHRKDFVNSWLENSKKQITNTK